jgi:hypothetical protein
MDVLVKFSHGHGLRVLSGYVTSVELLGPGLCMINVVRGCHIDFGSSCSIYIPTNKAQ